MTASQAVFVIGLILDIVGAFVLAQGFIIKHLTDLTWEGTSGYGSPPNLRYIASAIAQKADAQVGFAILALGFLTQAADYLYVDAIEGRLFRKASVIAAAALVALVASGLSIYARRYLVRRYGSRMVPVTLRAMEHDNGVDVSWMKQVITWLAPHARPSSEEDDEAFAARITARYLC